jgi:hypothetical protein
MKAAKAAAATTPMMTKTTPIDAQHEVGCVSSPTSCTGKGTLRHEKRDRMSLHHGRKYVYFVKNLSSI